LKPIERFLSSIIYHLRILVNLSTKTNPAKLAPVPLRNVPECSGFVRLSTYSRISYK